MTNLPKILNYGYYSSKKYGVNSLAIDLGSIRLFYSYKTIVAYQDIEDGLVVSENVWTVTTGKHLNWIDNGDRSKRDKSKRKDSVTFQEMLNAALKRHIN